ncbi:MAG TPA: hypothetical protein VFC89_07250 [Oscillospiraceae bacterium]|nr:hypothetical protein [Oscillospiraceae bacterium]
MRTSKEVFEKLMGNPETKKAYTQTVIDEWNEILEKLKKQGRLRKLERAMLATLVEEEIARISEETL